MKQLKDIGDFIVLRRWLLFLLIYSTTTVVMPNVEINNTRMDDGSMEFSLVRLQLAAGVDWGRVTVAV